MRGFFDFETWDWVNPFFCGFAWGSPDQREQYTLGDVPGFDFDKWEPDRFAEDCLLFMAKESQVTQWWAHNMGKFDGLIISAAAKRLGWKQQANIRGDGRIIALTLWPEDSARTVKLFDSYAVIPSKLETAAKDFELETQKLFTADDYSIDPRTWDKQRLRAGCLADCLVGLELLDKAEGYFREFGGSLKSTFSASALTVVKAHLAKTGDAIPSHKRLNKLDLNKTSRKAYYGARIEVLCHAPQEPVTEWDVASSYPWAMSQQLPWHPVGNGNQKSFDILLSEQTQYEGIIEAEVTVPSDMEFPPLPFRPDKGGVYFPTGSWRGWFPACELRYALSLGVLVNPADSIVYEAEQPFTSYINEVYALKSTAQGALRSFAKFILNGSYGKLSSRPEKHDFHIFPLESQARDFIMNHPGKCKLLSSDGTTISFERELWADFCHFPAAAYITAYARIKLHMAMCRSTGLAYVDSDSIHAGTLDLPAGEFGDGLGQWKVEVPLLRGEYFAPKVYRLQPLELLDSGKQSTTLRYHDSGKGHYASKGFPVNQSSFEQLVAGNKVPVERMQAAKTQFKQGNTGMARKHESKQWRGVSGKRCPTQDGTRPWSVEELKTGIQYRTLSPLVKGNDGK